MNQGKKTNILRIRTPALCRLNYQGRKLLAKLAKERTINRDLLAFLEGLSSGEDAATLFQRGFDSLVKDPSKKPNRTLGKYFYFLSELRALPSGWVDLALDAMVYLYNDEDLPCGTRKDLVIRFEKLKRCLDSQEGRTS